MALRKPGANWVEGKDRFFDQEADLAMLTERVWDRIHTLVVAQRRMGKTSLARELLRRLGEKGEFETVFVDVEDADAESDAMAAIAAGSMSVQGTRQRILAEFGDALRGVGNQVHELGFAEIQMKQRGGIDTGNGRWRGDGDFRIVSGPIEDWWHARHFVPIALRRT